MDASPEIPVMTLRRMPLLERLDHQDLLELGSEWVNLRRESSATSPFMTWAWVEAWLETVGVDVDLQVVTARDPDSGRLIGIAPFYVAEARHARVRQRELRMIGSGVAAPDHLDLIVHHESSPDVAEAMWNAVNSSRRWHQINLDGIVVDGHLSRVSIRRRDDEATAIPCPYLPLLGGWDVVESRFESRLRKNLARYGRALERDAEVTEWMVTDPMDLDDTFDHLVRFHQAIRTANGDRGVFADPDMLRFLRAAAGRLLQAGRLRLWRLDADGTAIAVIMCIRSGDSVAFYTTGYDPEWSKYGPGRRIMARAIRGAIDEGATEFDFLRGDEPYKHQWGTSVRFDLNIRRPAGSLGRLVGFLAATVRLIRRGLRRDGGAHG